MDVSILMPCLNESETLAICIKKANNWIKSSGYKAEIVIADNGSIDGSQDIARNLGAKVIDVREKGYGAALYFGALATKGKWIIMGDSDDSYDFGSLSPFVTHLANGSDLVMGNRFLGGIEKGAMPWKNQYIGNPALTFVGRVLFKCPSRDFHCGLRAFTRDAFDKMDLRTSGMEFASEMVIKANFLKMKITEVPTTLSVDGRSRPPHLKPWRDGWRHLRFMLLFSPKWLFFIPGLIIFLISFVSYVLLFLGPISIGEIEFNYNSMIFAGTGIIVGYLFLGFSLIVSLLAAKEGLIPSNQLLSSMQVSYTLEWGSSIGILSILIGLLLFTNAIGQWSDFDFSNLPDLELIRQVSLSTLIITIGAITFLFSLVMGFLSLPTRRK